jgi:hypothetical protein
MRKNNNKEGLLLTLMYLTVPLRVCIFNYLGQTQEEFMDMTLVSKQVYKDCKRPGIEWKIIPTIEIRPQRYLGNDSMRPWILMQNLRQHLLNYTTKEKLQCYRHIKMNDTHKFEGTNIRELLEKVLGLQMDWILASE